MLRTQIEANDWYHVLISVMTGLLLLAATICASGKITASTVTGRQSVQLARGGMGCPQIRRY